MQWMLDEGIATRRGVMCAHREPAYRQEPWRCAGDHVHGPDGCPSLAQSEEICGDGLILPLFDGLEDDDQRRVARGLARAIANENRRLFP
jgi:dTDP-4-amino-4,6-dideoxygalactose transaminase